MTGSSAARRKVSAWRVVGLSVGGVVLALLAVFGGVFATRTFLLSPGPATSSLSASTTAGAVEATAGAAGSTAATATAGASTPDAAVSAWFAALATADIAAVKRTATSDFATAVGPDMFEGRDPNTSYRVISSQTIADIATIDVQESPSTAAAPTATTLTLARQGDGTWLVAGYTVTATGQTVGATPSADTQSASPVTSTISKAEAIDVVRRFLNDIRSGNGKVATALATTRFKSANPGWISGPDSGFKFEITGAKKKDSTWVVTTDEKWESGDDIGTYTVVVQEGKGYVDRRNELD
jgi:hypothetical protein